MSALALKRFFATHYHELIGLADKLDHAANYSVAVQENDEGVVFLYTIQAGGVNRSYGIEVAKLAGLPAEVVARAGQILHDLELGNHEAGVQQELANRPDPAQSALFDEEPRQHHPLKKALDAIDPNTMTPLEALQKIQELKGM